MRAAVLRCGDTIRVLSSGSNHTRRPATGQHGPRAEGPLKCASTRSTSSRVRSGGWCLSSVASSRSLHRPDLLEAPPARAPGEAVMCGAAVSRGEQSARIIQVMAALVASYIERLRATRGFEFAGWRNRTAEIVQLVAYAARMSIWSGAYCGCSAAFPASRGPMDSGSPRPKRPRVAGCYP